MINYMVLKQVRQHDKTDKQPLGNLVKSLYLPTFASQYQSVGESFEQDGKTYKDYLQELAIRELDHRHQQRIARLLKQPKLSRDKLLSNFDIKRIPGLTSTKIKYLVQGEFMDRYENILIFGNPRHW